MLALTAALLAVFVINVSMGSFGSSAFLGTVGEMLLLLAVTVTFVTAILQREANK